MKGGKERSLEGVHEHAISGGSFTSANNMGRLGKRCMGQSVEVSGEGAGEIELV